MNIPTISPFKFAVGAGGVAATVGMFYGMQSAPEGSVRSEQMERGIGVAGAFGIMGFGAAMAAPPVRDIAKGAVTRTFGNIKSWTSEGRSGFSADRAIGTGRINSLYKNFGTTGAFVTGGAVLGAVIGGASSDDTAKGAARGALIGAGTGFVAKQAISAISAYKRSGNFAGPGIAGVAVLASAALFTGVRAATRTPASMQYGETDAAGETQYSDSPVRDRLRSMNASGDLVFGLNNQRRG